MYTLDTRRQIGFPADRLAWVNAPANFGPHTLRIAGHPVMEDWESGYMARLAAIACSRGGRILEIGYGMGISARAIEALGIDHHCVIECHPDVIHRAVVEMRERIAGNTFHLFGGFWQDVAPLLASESFDGILFDTYPLMEDEVHRNHFPFFEMAHRLLKPGGVFTYYSDEAREFSPDHLDRLLQAGFDEEEIQAEICEVDPPADCKYWREKTLLAPIVHKGGRPA